MAVNALKKNAAHELATLSGGEYINFTTQKGFDNGLHQLSNHIHNYYLLSFQPHAEANGTPPPACTPSASKSPTTLTPGSAPAKATSPATGLDTTELAAASVASADIVGKEHTKNLPRSRKKELPCWSILGLERDE